MFLEAAPEADAAVAAVLVRFFGFVKSSSDMAFSLSDCELVDISLLDFV